MKNSNQKIKRKLYSVIAYLLSSITIFFSVFNYYSIPVQATAEVGIYLTIQEIIQYYLASTGIVLSQNDIDNSGIVDLVDDMVNERVTDFVSVDGTKQTVNWADENSVNAYWARTFVQYGNMYSELEKASQAQANGEDYIVPEEAQSLINKWIVIDKYSYNNFGVTASEAILKPFIMGKPVKDANGDDIGFVGVDEDGHEVNVKYGDFAKDLLKFLKGRLPIGIGGGGPELPGDGNDNDNGNMLKKMFLRAGLGILCSAMVSSGSLDNLSTILSRNQEMMQSEAPYDSGLSYEDLGDIIYDGNYERLGDSYIVRASTSRVLNGQLCTYITDSNGLSIPGKVGAYDSGTAIVFLYYNSDTDNFFNPVISRNIYNTEKDGSFTLSSTSVSKTGYFGYFGSYSTNVPVFSTSVELKSYLRGETDDSACINKVVNENTTPAEYADFLSNPAPNVALHNNSKTALSAGLDADGNYSSTSMTEDDIKAVTDQIEDNFAEGTDETPNEHKYGTEEGTKYITGLFEKLANELKDRNPASGTEDPKEDEKPQLGAIDYDEKTGSINYMTILGSILAAIQALPQQIFDLFESILGSIKDTVTKGFEDLTQYIDHNLTKGIFKDIFDSLHNIEDFFIDGIENMSFIDIIQSLIDSFESIIDQLADTINSGIQNIIDALDSVLDIQAIQDFFTVPLENIINALRDMLNALTNGSIVSTLNSILDKIPILGTVGGAVSDSDKIDLSNSGSLLKILIYLVLILIMFLVIFVNCLRFIITIYAVPATTGFLPAEMVLALNYLKSLEIQGIGLSVYDFCMALINMMIFFSIIKLLRREIYKFRMPRKF